VTIELDHLILPVNDLDASVRFYAEVLGLQHEGQDGPFAVLRVSPSLTLQLAPWGTQGGEHLALALAPDEFDATFTRLRDAGVPYGDSYHDVANMRGPGTETGARGPGATVYFNDPDGHLLEIRCYAS
jgi:catechol 2,3-dioxygenase-like lactoylglutathione lyase family enzyme